MSSLAAQLAQISAKSKASLDVKAQKAAHSKSLIWEPKVAATQTYASIFKACYGGFEDLCGLDARFVPFSHTLFSEQSQDEDRALLSKEENQLLDRKIESFLRLVASRVRLMPAIKAVEWLIRRFRIHEYNTAFLITTFLPFHSIPAFVTLLSILPKKIPVEYRFLSPYIRSAQNPPRAAIVLQAINSPAFLAYLSEYTLESCRLLQHYQTQVSFWGGIMTEAINGQLDRAKTGRSVVQADNDMSLLHHVGPVLGEALVTKKVPQFQIAAYMALSVFVSKGDLGDSAVSAFMEQIVAGWTAETVRSGLICMTILSQYRSAKQVSGKVAKALLKVADVEKHLLEIGREWKIDKLANGFCLALAERCLKKGDSRGLRVIKGIMTAGILTEKQLFVLFKVLLVTAMRLDDEADKDGHVRKDLGTVLIDLSNDQGECGEVIQKAIEDVDFDMDALEMKLDLSIRRKMALEPTETEQPEVEQVTEDVRETLSALKGDKKSSLSGCLSADAGSVFDTLTRVFLLIVSSPPEDQSVLENFCKLPVLSYNSAVSDTTYISFFLRIISGAYPALARAAALEMVKTRLKATDVTGQDFQALLPYCMAALNDPSKKVRQAASDLVVVVVDIYPKTSKPPQLPVWGQTKLYADGANLEWLTTTMASATLRDILMPSLEECIMSHDHVCSTLEAVLDSTKSSLLKSPARLSLLKFLAGQILATPSLVVKSRLLTAINRVKGVGSTTRTQLLLPVLLWWAKLSPAEALRLGERDNVDLENLNKHIVGVIVPNDAKGLESLLEILKKTAAAAATETEGAAEAEGRTSFTQAIFGRVQSMWPAMKAETRSSIANTMLELSQAPESPEAIYSEAAELLRNVELDTDVLLAFLATLDMPTSSAATSESFDMRRRVSLDGPAASLANAALRRATFVLQLVEGAGPAAHPQILSSLFKVLAKLHSFRNVVGSELGYLQNLILQSILAIVPVYRDNKDLKLSIPQSHGELIVNCIQSPTVSPVVQNSALLVIAALAATAPEVVVHVVMPVFAFVGASILRQSDDYSAYVVNQTIREVVPPLLDSFRRGKRNPVSSAAELLIAFTASYSHVPAHRRQRLFTTLVDTLGAQEFLFAVVAMLVNKEEASPSIISFVGELARKYSVAVQLDTCLTLVGLVSESFVAPPTMASALLGDSVKGIQNARQVALRQLRALTALLLGRKLKSQAAKAMAKDDMEAAQARELYSTLLQKILALSETLKGDKVLRAEVGNALAALLNLLSIGEFVKAVEGLLDNTGSALRHRVLQALESRIEAESNTDSSSRTVLLGFLPTLIAALREAIDVRYKYTAVSCIDKLAEKYGRKDPEGVVAAAATIAGDSCLGASDARLRIMALLCLASLVDVLEDHIVPVLPGALSRAIAYLGESVTQNAHKNSDAAELHAAGYTFILSVAQQLPYMISTTHLDQILLVSHASASVDDLPAEVVASRTECLDALATVLDPKVVFTALSKAWAGAINAGFAAADAHVALLGRAIDKHSKATISKNVAPLSALLLDALDARRVANSRGQTSELALPRFAALETAVNAVALKLVYKLNDAVFKPVFTRMIEWSASGLPASDVAGRTLRSISVYGFLRVFFDALKGIVTSYAGYVIDDAVRLLSAMPTKTADDHRLRDAVLGVLTSCFTHDSDEFWQGPAHFQVIMPVLLVQFSRATSVSEPPVALIDATVALAGAADSQVHQKEINSGLLKHLRSENAATRLAAVLAEQKMADTHGEEWLAMLPEMLPFIGELQEDDDEIVERETNRWIVKIETVLGEPLDAMLQ